MTSIMTTIPENMGKPELCDIDIRSGDRSVIDQYLNTTYVKNWKTTRLDYDDLTAACQIRGQNNNEI
jgi:hypothetical protein